MKNNAVNGFSISIFGAFAYIGILESFVFFLPELLAPYVYSFLFALMYVYFSPLRKINYKYLYRRSFKRLFRISIIVGVVITGLMFGILDNYVAKGFANNLVFAQMWIFICVLLSVADAYIEKRKILSMLHIFVGVAFGVVLFVFTLIVCGIAAPDRRVIISAGLFFIFCFNRSVTDYMSMLLAVAKIKILNGPLRGEMYALDDDISLIGNQCSDTINLWQYPDVNHSHAKIIRLGNVFSLSDNDPYSRTLLNSSRATDKILKNNDIVTIGTAKFLFIYR